MRECECVWKVVRGGSLGFSSLDFQGGIDFGFQKFNSYLSQKGSYKDEVGYL